MVIALTFFMDTFVMFSGMIPGNRAVVYKHRPGNRRPDARFLNRDASIPIMTGTGTGTDRAYTINGKAITFDGTKTYHEYYLNDGHGELSSIDFVAMLDAMQSGKIAIDASLEQFLTTMSRWIVEAPRKRTFREIKTKKLAMVLSSENFFDEEPDGDKIIDGLYNTGKFAGYLLHELFGK
jgi:hypothetical protein